MRRLLAANLLRMRKTFLFWGTLLFHAAFALFRIYTIYQDRKFGYQTTLDEALFTVIMVEGLTIAVFTAVFLGTEYSDGAVRNKIAVGHSRMHIYLANLLTVSIACLLFIAVYLLAILAVGLPVLGSPALSVRVILNTLLGTLATAAAFCSLYTFVGMSVSQKSTGCILCILLFFGMMIASTYVAARLDAPAERAVFEMVDGEMVSHIEPNPKYLSDSERAVYQFAMDFLPTGQATQYMIMTGRTGRMSLYSVLIALCTAGGGQAYFRRKDIK